MIVVFALLLLKHVAGQFPPYRLSEGKKMTPEQFRAIPDDPFSDPADDIPEVPSYAKPGDSPASLMKSPENLLPRDRHLEDQKRAENLKQKGFLRDRPLWINFPELHDKLIQDQARPDATTRKPFRSSKYNYPQSSSMTDKIFKQKMAQIDPWGFGMELDKLLVDKKIKKFKPIEYTTCEEFKRGSHNFNPEDIINLVWIPFYSWSPEIEGRALVHKFTIPTQREIYYYHSKFGQYLNLTALDWTQHKLHFDCDLGAQQALLVALDNTGLYHFIFDIGEVPEYVQRHKIKIPSVYVRLKIVKDYLAMMYCEQNYAVIMAIDGHVPITNKDKREEAKILGYKGKGRALIRDINDEMMAKQIEEEVRREKEALKYLPTGENDGYFANVPKQGDRRIGGRRERTKKKNVLSSKSLSDDAIRSK